MSAAPVNFLEPITKFWKHTTEEFQQSEKAHEEKNERKMHKKGDFIIHELAQPDFKLYGQNSSQLANVVRHCRFYSGDYNFYNFNFDWFPLFGYADLMAKEITNRLQKLPEVSVTSVWNWISNAGNSFKFELDNDKEEEVVVRFADGGTSCLHIYKPKLLLNAANPHTPVILFFPSLSENQDGFILSRKFCTDVKNWYVVVVNRRGLCQALQTPKFWVSGNDEDTRDMLARLRSMSFMKNRPVFAVGWSMGGGNLTRYLGRYHKEKDRTLDGIVAAGCISGPFHSRDVCLVHEHTWRATLAGFLKRAFIHRKVNKFGDTYLDLFRHEAHPSEESKRQYEIYKKLSETESVYEFIFLHYHLLYDFTNEDIAHYLKTSCVMSKEARRSIEEKSIIELVNENCEHIFSFFEEEQPVKYAHKIAVPFVAICSDDDFIVRWTQASKDTVLSSPFTTLISTKSGGHCVFTDSPFDTTGKKSWAENVIFAHFEDVLKDLKKG